MNKPPEYLDGAKVLFWTLLDDRNKRTGKLRLYANGTLQTEFHGLAIAAYEDKNGIPKQETYLFFCDENWEVENDTYHDSVDAAKAQAEMTFTGIDEKWKPK